MKQIRKKKFNIQYDKNCFVHTKFQSENTEIERKKKLKEITLFHLYIVLYYDRCLIYVCIAYV